jgi:hypothetical protein
MKKGIQRAIAGVLVVAALVQMVSVAFVKPDDRK